MAEDNKQKPVEKKEEVKTTPVKTEKVNEEEKPELKKESKPEAKPEIKKEESKKFEPVKPAGNETAKKEPGTKKTEKSQKEKAKKEKPIKESGKKRGILARIIAVLIILLAIAGLIYLAMPSPERTVTNMLQKLKEGKLDEVKEYVDYKSLVNIPALGVESSENGELTKEEQEQQKWFYHSLAWKVISVENKGDTATAEVQITNKNYKTVIQNYAQKVLQKAFKGETTSEEEMNEYLIDELKRDDIEQVTSTQTISIEKQEGKWKVKVDENLREAIFPKLSGAINSLNSIGQ